MKRLHVHIAVDHLADSIRFYSALFAAEPSIIQSDYAKWILDDPRVNFAISQRRAAIGLNHLGVQVESANELAEMRQRLHSLQAEVTEEADAACCYAKSDKYWVNDPQGIAWETFHTLDTLPIFGGEPASPPAESGCCVPLAKTDNASPCCVPTGKPQAAAGTCC